MEIIYVCSIDKTRKKKLKYLISIASQKKKKRLVQLLIIAIL